MARPVKWGIDYFPLDVNLQNDPEVQMITAEFGFKGEFIFIKLLSAIYKQEGYYMKWDERNQLLFANSVAYCGASANMINEVVDRCVRWGLFNKSVFDVSMALTSKRIQRTWKEAVRKRGDKDVIPEIWLLDSFRRKTPEETPKKAEETTQSKVKKSKEEKIIKKEPEVIIRIPDELPTLKATLLASEIWLDGCAKMLSSIKSCTRPEVIKLVEEFFIEVDTRPADQPADERQAKTFCSNWLRKRWAEKNKGGYQQVTAAKQVYQPSTKISEKLKGQ